MDLYHNNMSVCAQKVRLVLAEKGLQPTEHHLDLGAGDSHTKEYLALNPKGVVPTLVDNGQPIIESTVICEYLEDAYADVPLRPKAPLARAKMRIWTLIPDAGLHLWCSTVSFAIAWRHQDRTKQMAMWTAQVRAERMEAIELGVDAPLVAPHLRNYVGILRKMGTALRASRWLCGDDYSLADIAMLPYVYRFDDMALNWVWEQDRDLRPIADWLDRCRARPGFVGIENHHDRTIVSNMRRHGAECRDKIKSVLADGGDELTTQMPVTTQLPGAAISCLG
jgi:glutathione S-transferase